MLSSTRWVWLVLCLSLIVLLPRSLSIAASHGRTWDEGVHLEKGLAFLTGTLLQREDLDGNDPPLAGALAGLPLLALNAIHGEPLSSSGIHGRPFSPLLAQKLLYAWKALLFLPAIAVLFVWCRELYGTLSALAATALLVLDPTFAAHIPVPAADTIGVEFILIACYLYSRYARSPTVGRLLYCAAATAFALLVRHTAFVLPAIWVLVVGLSQIRAWREQRKDSALRAVSRGALLHAGFAVSVALFIWAGLGFDVSPPGRWFLKLEREKMAKETALGVAPTPMRGAERARALGLDRPWPGGWYLGTVLVGAQHAKHGRFSYLLGQQKSTGWWYYQPILALYKVPLAFLGLLLLGVASFWWKPLRFEEIFLLISGLVLMLFVMWSGISVGFRHALPFYIFFIALGSRVVASASRPMQIALFGLIVAGGMHAASFHPDYLSYVNFPRDRVYLEISESNLDWGQGLPQVRKWLDERTRDGRPVHLSYFGSDSVQHVLGDRVVLHDAATGPPRSGLYIVSPIFVVGTFGARSEDFAEIRGTQPDAVIGHSLLVFDMDRIVGMKRP